MVALWEKSFPARLKRAFWRNSDSAAAWNQMVGALGTKSDGAFFRFDITFESDPPALDRVESMAKVAQMTDEAARLSAEMPRAAGCIRASHFVFELDATRPLLMRNGAFPCVGTIRCRLRAGTDEFSPFMTQLAQSKAFFRTQGRALPSSFSCEKGRGGEENFSQEIALHVPSRSQPFAIMLEDKGSACHISGSPFTLQWLIEQQGLDASFGRHDHQP
jgi:hypothetical protein